MYIFDLETDGLLGEATKMHCLATIPAEHSIHHVRLYTDEPGVLSKRWLEDNDASVAGTIEAGLVMLLQTSQPICGHNICGFDLLAAKTLYNKNFWHKVFPPELNLRLFPDQRDTLLQIYDTFMLSCLLFPERYEHGLESWGKELGLEKPDQEQWQVFDESMAFRCITDVRINKKLINNIMLPQIKADHKEDIRLNWNEPLLLEQAVQYIHAEQEMTGVRYDVLMALELMKKLDKRIEELREHILRNTEQKVVSPFTVEVKTPWTKAGKPAAMVLKHYDNDMDAIKKANIRGPFTRVDYAQLNLDSDVQVKEYLMKLGWKPTEWNVSKKTRQRTSPKLTEDSYDSLPPGIGQDIAEYNICTHRRGMIANRKGEQTGALWNVRPDGRISAQAFTCGTPTSRYRHKGVVCNIPRPDTPYGEEIRSLFCVPEEWYMVGTDLKGIEIRMAAHFIYRYEGGPKLVQEILHGDFHQGNADIWDVKRGDAKTGLYALMYGCTPPKLAQALKKPKSLANKLFNDFWSSRMPLKLLNQDLERSYKAKGFLVGLDRRKLQIREARKLLNTLIQGGSAVVFKRWMVMNYLEIKSFVTGREVYHQLIGYHDELQYESRSPHKYDAESLAGVLRDNALKAGSFYNLDVPIEADVKIGKNWSECH